jgi:hypothetical protein
LILGCFGRFGFDGVVNDLEKEKKLNFFFLEFCDTFLVYMFI